MSLEDIREQKTSKGVYIIIGLLLIGMAGFGTSQFGIGGGTSTAAVMTTDEAEISQLEYDNTLRSIQQNSPGLDAAVAQQQALGYLQQRLALSDYISRYPLIADAASIDQSIMDNPAFFDNGEFSEEQFRRVIRVEPDVFRDSLSKDLALNELQRTLAETAVVSQAEIAPYLALQGLSRDIFVAKISQSQFTNTANDTEIAAYYDAHKNQYLTDEQISIEYIDFNPKAIEKAVVISDDELAVAATPPRQAAYYLFADKAQAQSAYERLQNGENLSDIQQDLAGLEDSGDLGAVNRIAGEASLIPQTAIDAIYDLSEIGEVTSPMEIDDTVYLFALTAKGDGEMSDAERTAAKTALQAEKAKPQITALQEKLNKAVFESGSPSLQSIAEQTELPISQSGLLSTHSGESILAVPEVLTAIENGDKTVSKLQEPITIGERVIIYQLTEVQKPEQKSLESVKSLVEQAVIAEKTKKQIDVAADKLLAEAKSTSLTTAASNAGYPTQSIDDFKGKVQAGEVLDPLAAILIAQQPPSLGDKNAQKLLSPNGDAYVFVNTAVRLGNGDEEPEQKQLLQQQLSQQLGGLELSEFIQSLVKRTDIDINRSLVNQ